MRQSAAEFMGTFVLLMFGMGSVAQAKLGGAEFGSILSINLAWGIGVVLGVCVSGAVSGGHLNPAVTLAVAVRGQFEWKKVPWYILAQIAGAFVASEVVYLTYFEAFNAFDKGVRQIQGPLGTAGIFATYPAAHLSTFPGGFLDQFIATALLIFCVFGIGDPRNASWSKPVGPLLVGLLVVGIGMAFGFNAGYAINPARDFGPRLFTAFFGWGRDVFSVGNYWSWVPVVAPCLGGIAGAGLYAFTLGEEKLPSPQKNSNGTVPATSANHPTP